MERINLKIASCSAALLSPLLLALASTPAAAAGMTLDEAEALIRAGEHERALEALLAQEADRSGEQRYDYLLGLAALRAGRPDLASYALERVLIVTPEFLDARLAMARAYVALGSDDLAREELTALRAADPPEWATRTIDQLLEILDERSKKTRLSFSLEGGFGHDTNINGATDAGQVSAAGLVNATLNPTGTINLTGNTKEGDQYVVGRINAGLTHEITEQLTFSANATGGHREYISSDGQELTDFGAGTAFVHTTGPDTVSFSFGLRRTELDHTPYQNLMNIGVGWQHRIDPMTSVGVFGQHARQRYIRSSDQGNDSNLNTAGASVTRRLDEAGRTTVSGGFIVGYDDERNTRTDGDRRMGGLQLGAEHRLRPDLVLFGSMFGLMSDYSRTNPIFRVNRNDTLLTARVGATWLPAKDWQVLPQVSYTNNESNVPLNDYDRVDVGVRVRWTY